MIIIHLKLDEKDTTGRYIENNELEIRQLVEYQLALLKMLTSGLPVIDVTHEGRVFHVIQDHTLPTGTKQRGIKFFEDLKTAGYEEILSYASSHGYGQVVLSYCAQKCGLKATVFIEGITPRTPYTELAISFGGNIIELPGVTLNKDLQQKTEEYFETHPNQSKVKLLRKSFDDPKYIEALAQNIIAEKGNIQPTNMWLAAGAAVLLRALHKIWPDTMFHVVRVGMMIPPEILATVKHKLYVAPFHYHESTSLPPPYESVPNYDAKVWYFVTQYGNDGDYIWNVY